MPQTISIHALREEGDPRPNSSPLAWRAFLSTPSARRATAAYADYKAVFFISIHALREEGDSGRVYSLARFSISIHALREEGDHCLYA